MKETTIRRPHQIRKALETDQHLPTSVTRHIDETLEMLDASTQGRIKKILAPVKDPQVIIALCAVVTGVLTTMHSESNSLADKSMLDYLISASEYYINAPDKDPTSTVSQTAARIASSASKFVAIGFGLSEIWEKYQNRQTKEKDIESGIFPAPYQNHLVAMGMRDPLLFAEDEFENSFVKNLRRHFGQMVMVQKNGPYYEPSELATKLNDKEIYANISELDDGTPVGEMTKHILVSGAYKASGILINLQRGHELFEEVVSDKQTQIDSERPNLSTSGYFVKNTLKLRNAFTNIQEDPRVALVMPLHMRQKYYQHEKKTGKEDWERAVLANFGDHNNNLPAIEGVVIPERIFIDMIVNQLKDRDLQGEDTSIYIDTEGQDQGQQKAELCKKALWEACKQAGIDIKKSNIFVKPEEAKDKTICVMLRANNRHIDASSRVNQHRLNHQYVFYPATTRHDIIDHRTEKASEQTRIPILYKQEIARLSEEILTGEASSNNPYAISALQKSGKLKN